MRNADPGYETEVHLGVGIADQKAFKDTADGLLTQDGAFVRTIRAQTAALISEVIGEPVSPNQITVSDPINNVEEFQLRGPGNRTHPDGRVINDGGYEIQVSYIASPDTKNGGAPNRTYYLYKLWFRRSKTEIGVTRRLILPVAMFMARENPATGEPSPQVNQFLDGLFERIYPRWLAFLNELEANELEGYLEGRFEGFNPADTLPELADSLDTLLKNTPVIRKTKFSRLAADSEKATYSRIDADNIREQDAATESALGTLKVLLGKAEPFAGRLRTVQSDPGLFQTEVERLRNELNVPSGSEALLSRNELASSLAKNLVSNVFRWKVNRVLEGFADHPDQAAERLAQVVEDLNTFVGQGTAAQHYPEARGAAYPNLVVAKIILSKEESTANAGLEEGVQPSLLQKIPVRLEDSRKLVILTPQTAEAGIRALSIFSRTADGSPGGRGFPVAVIVESSEQELLVRTLLRDSDLTLWNDQLINLSQMKPLTQAEAEVNIQTAAWERGMDTYVVRFLHELFGISSYLDLPTVSVRLWKKWLDQIGVSSNL